MSLKSKYIKYNSRITYEVFELIYNALIKKGCIECGTPKDYYNNFSKRYPFLVIEPSNHFFTNSINQGYTEISVDDVIGTYYKHYPTPNNKGYIKLEVIDTKGFREFKVGDITWVAITYIHADNTLYHTVHVENNRFGQNFPMEMFKVIEVVDNFVLPKKWCIKVDRNNSPSIVHKWRNSNWGKSGYISYNKWHNDTKIADQTEISLFEFERYVLGKVSFTSPNSTEKWHIKIKDDFESKIYRNFFNLKNPDNSWAFCTNYEYGYNGSKFVSGSPGKLITFDEFCKTILKETPVRENTQLFFEYVKCINLDFAYTNHPEAVLYGCTNFQKGQLPICGAVYKIVKFLLINDSTPGYIISYNGLEYIIGEGGLEVSTKDVYDHQFLKPNDETLMARAKKDYPIGTVYRSAGNGSERTVLTDSHRFYKRDHIDVDGGPYVYYNGKWAEIVKAVEPKPNTIAIKDLVKGEVYYCSHKGQGKNVIYFTFDKITKPDPVSNNYWFDTRDELLSGSFNSFGSFSNSDYYDDIRLLTPIEKDRFRYCVLTRKYMSLDDFENLTFRKGDKVMLIQNTCGSSNKIGDVGIISEIYNDSYRVEVEGKHDTCNFSKAKDLELLAAAGYLKSAISNDGIVSNTLSYDSVGGARLGLFRPDRHVVIDPPYQYVNMSKYFPIIKELELD